jgi:hypothetical protein
MKKTNKAIRDDEDYKLDYEGCLNPLVLERFAEYMHKHTFMPDGTRRASDNWQKGFPLDRLARSKMRHSFEFWKSHRGYEVKDRKTKEPVDIEDILCAEMFNTMAYLLRILENRKVEK